MFVEDIERSRRLVDGNEFLSALQSQHQYRHLYERAEEIRARRQILPMGRTLRTFSGFVWGGGGILADVPGHPGRSSSGARTLGAFTVGKHRSEITRQAGTYKA